MGYVIPIAMVAMAAIGTGLSIAGNISANRAAQRQAAQALRSNDSQLRVAENTGILQAQQQSSERTRTYNQVISSQSALWATRGIQLSSGTVSNVAEQSTEAYDRDVSTIELNRMNRLASIALQGADFQYAAANAVGAAHTRMITGITNSLLSFGQTAASAGTGIYKGMTAPTGAGSPASVPTYGGGLGGSGGPPTGTVVPF